MGTALCFKCPLDEQFVPSKDLGPFLPKESWINCHDYIVSGAEATIEWESMQFLKMTVLGCLAAALLAGCSMLASFQKPPVDTTLRFYEQSASALPAENAQFVVLPHTDVRVAVNPFPTLTEKDVQSAEMYNTAGGKAIFLRFDPHGLIVLDEMTTRTKGQYVVVMVDNHPVSAWLVDQRIINGQFLVEGEFTDEEAQKIVDDLNKLSKINNRQ
jgi:hypothetical protein